MDKSAYLVNFIHDFLADDSRRLAFVSDQRNILKQYYIEKNIISQYNKEEFYLHTFSAFTIGSPYEPFVDIIEKYYKNYYADKVTAKDFIKACNIYSLHESVFSSYLLTGKSERYEKMINVEAEYEKHMMLKSILSILKYISSENRITIILNKLQFALLSTLRILEMIAEDKSFSNIKILIIYNEDTSAFSHCQNTYSKWITDAEAKGLLFDYDYVDGSGYYEDVSSLISESFPLDRSYMPEYNRRLNNLYRMLAFEDMEYYIDRIYNRLLDENIRLKLNDAFTFYGLAALCYIVLKKENKASVMIDRMGSMYDKKREPEKDFRFNYVCHQYHVAIEQDDLGIKYAYSCIDIARRLADEKRIFLSVVLYYEAAFNGWKSVFKNGLKVLEGDSEFVDKLSEMQYYNTLAHYLVYGFNNDDESIKRLALGEESHFFKDAIEIIHKIGNTDLEIAAYTKYIVLMTNKGHHKEVDEYYDKELCLLEDSDNPRGEANLYLGRGYSMILNEEYVDAEATFNNAIHIMYGMKDVESICEAIYNMAINRFAMQDYKHAGELIGMLMKMLSNFGVRTIQLCSQCKLVALNALSLILTGNDYKCYVECKKMKKLLSVQIENCDIQSLNKGGEEETYLYNLVMALLSIKSKKYTDAVSFFEIARKLLNDYSNILFYTAAIFYANYYKLLINMGMMDNAEEIKFEAYEFCDANSFEKMYEYIELIIKDEPIAFEITDSPFTDFAAVRLLGLSVEKGKDRLIERQNKDIWFLSSWQEVLNRELEEKRMMDEAINYLQDSFNFDKLVYFTVDNDSVEKIYGNEYFDSKDCVAVLELNNRIKRDVISTCIDKEFQVYEPYLKLLGETGIYSIVGIPVFVGGCIRGIFAASITDRNIDNLLLGGDDLAVVKAAVIQIHNTLERNRQRAGLLEANTKLNQLAITDQLTGLHNRQGLVKVLDDIDGEFDSLTVLYMDLDNFKYYNDNFGHEMGDEILHSFARILVKNIPEGAYGFRYGGDEFIVIIPTIICNDAEDVARNINNSLLEKIKSLVLDNIDDDYHIPEDKKLSCSIGIAKSDTGYTSDIYDTIKKADEALYDIKRSSKCGYKTWS